MACTSTGGAENADEGRTARLPGCNHVAAHRKQMEDAYTDEEIKAIVNGVSEGANDYTFDLPENALLGRGGFWYDETAAAAITGHADPLTMNEEGVFFTADGTAVASPIAA